MRLKHLLLFLCIFCFCLQVQAETLTGSVEFNWDKLSQTERNNDIQNIKTKIFNKDIIYKFDKAVFKVEYQNFKKDENYIAHYTLAQSNYFNLKNEIIVPFYMKKLLLAYGIIYKNDLTHCYYYDAMGHLFIIELFEHNYNNYPVTSYQYDTNGKLLFVVYALNKYDDYIYESNGNFLGRCYKENCYNKSGKVKLIRFMPQD